MRGEHIRAFVASIPGLGSSPRARGTRTVFDDILPTPGIIPACAGNTVPTPGRVILTRDHPRVRGEHWHKRDGRRTLLGSSPRARGTPVHRVVEFGKTGIIPACAGNTICEVQMVSKKRDHPRVCGEHTMSRYPISHVTGSSPRVRGTLENYITNSGMDGIIPACAGNT